MAYTLFDAFGREPVAQTEEELAANAKPVTQTIKTNPVTGEQTMTVSGSPQDLSAANPLTPTVSPVAPVAPAAVNPTDARLAMGTQAAPMAAPVAAPMTAPVAAPVAPVSPDYAAYTQQQESGARPDIGFHYQPNAQGQRTSTAYGAYGLTAPAYQDVQAMAPEFANRPITSLTPDEQTRALQLYTQKNSQALRQYGVDPNEANIRLAHFLGARGASEYLSTGAISPAAAAANGGEERVRQIAQQRLAGGAAPASAAAAAPTAVAPTAVAPTAPLMPPAVGAGAEGTAGESEAQLQMRNAGAVLAEAGSDPRKLTAIYNNETLPASIKNAAADTAMRQLQFDQAQKKVEARVTEAIQTGDMRGVEKLLKQQGDTGSIAKAFLYSLIGFKSGAEAEVAKMNLPKEWKPVTDDAGKTSLVLYSTSGMPIRGLNSDGVEMSPQDVIKAGAGVKKDYDIVGGTFVSDTEKDSKGNPIVGSLYRSKTNPNDQFIQTSEGRKALSGFRPQSSGGSMDAQRQSQVQRQNIQLAGDWARMQMDVQKAGPVAGNKFIGEFNRKYGTNFNETNISGNSPQISTDTGQIVVGAPTAAAPTAAAPMAPVAPVAPSAANRPVVSGAGGATPAAIAAGIEVNKEVTGAEQKQFVEKVIPEIQKKGDDGKFIADTRKTQVAMLTGPNSAIMGIYRGSGSTYEKARAVLRDSIAGAYSGQEGGVKLSEDLRNLSIPAEQLSALKEFAQMNTGINAKTLAENAGEGPKSDADMRLNQQANMTNIGDLPAFAALTGLTRSQFAGDINKRKQDFLNSNRDAYKTQTQLEGAWSKEKDLLNRQYEGIYKARLNYIDSQMVQKYGQDWRKKSDDDTQSFYRNASIHSFNVLPTPNYDVQTQKFVYPTEQSKLAAMRAITGK
jgi:hypothetical protein